jgi:phosphatidylglycerophosphatase A
VAEESNERPAPAKGAKDAKKKLTISELVWSAGGLGFLPGPTGTYGTAAAIPVYFLLLWAGWPVYIAATVLLFFYGWRLSAMADAYYQSHDDKRLVIDEVVGYLATMMLAPDFDFLPFAPLWGFAWFRLFDILKPGPIGRIDKMTDSLSVMLDDVAAGLLACAAMWLTAAVGAVIRSPFLPELFSR